MMSYLLPQQHPHTILKPMAQTLVAPLRYSRSDYCAIPARLTVQRSLVFRGMCTVNWTALLLQCSMIRVTQYELSQAISRWDDQQITEHVL